MNLFSLFGAGEFFSSPFGGLISLSSASRLVEMSCVFVLYLFASI